MNSNVYTYFITSPFFDNLHSSLAQVFNCYTYILCVVANFVAEKNYFAIIFFTYLPIIKCFKLELHVNMTSVFYILHQYMLKMLLRKQ
jgi:hypothetical protein